MTTIFGEQLEKLSRPGNGRVGPAIYVLSGLHPQVSKRGLVFGLFGETEQMYVTEEIEDKFIFRIRER